MTYNIIWAVESRVLLTTFVGRVTKDDLLAYIDEMREKIKEGKQPLYHISNSLQLTKVELSLPALFSLVKSVGLYSALAWQIDVNLNPTNKMLAALSSQVIRLRSRTVPSLYDAVTFIKSVDDSLVDATWHIPAPEVVAP
ncbi:MAG: hypothetical protein SH821_16785 [Phototrophicales bacterium]|nr:hypothetical protein [Phototrophicales bacterium]